MSSFALDNLQIPAPSTSFVGRSDELVRLSALLRRPDVRLVTLTGPGGVGKTRLAIQVASELDPKEVGEIHLVLLANAPNADAVQTAIARTLGISQVGPAPLDELITGVIGDRSLLLILDNAEQVAQHLTFLSRLLGACPGLRIMVTSRVMLRLSAEHAFPVDPLSTVSQGEHELAPATVLFIERAHAVQPDLSLTVEDVRAIDDICGHIDGLPLAIELAAARTRFLSPTTLRDRLSERLQLLVGGPRDAPERHRTLRATLTWSHDLLSTEERLLFRRLAIFEHSGPYDAIDAVCNAAGDLGNNVEEILSALVDHSLVRIDDAPATGPRVRLLHTIREFAHEQIKLSGELAAMRQAHATWYAELVIRTPSETWRTGTPEIRTWTLRHVPDIDNFSCAFESLMDRQDTGTALRMVSGIVPFLLETGQLREGSDWTARLMPHAGEAPIDVQALFYRMAAIMAFNGDTFDEANRLASRALILAEQVGEPRLMANCQNLLGQIRWRMGDAVEGERLQRAAITTIKTVADPLAGALFASQIAESLIEEGDLDRAEPLLREAMPVVERERPEALPLLQGTLGYLALKRGDLDEASYLLERSLDYHRFPPHRLPGALAGRFLSIAELGVQRGMFRESARLVGAGMGICDRIGIVISSNDQADVEGVVSLIRPELGAEVLEKEQSAGRALSLPEAIDLALRVTNLRSAAKLSGNHSVPDYDLTPRELEVLGLLAEGKSNPAIAEALFISQRTVTTHLSRLYAKLDVSTRSEAMALAVRLGLIPSRAERT